MIAALRPMLVDCFCKSQLLSTVLGRHSHNGSAVITIYLVRMISTDDGHSVVINAF